MIISGPALPRSTTWSRGGRSCLFARDGEVSLLREALPVPQCRKTHASVQEEQTAGPRPPLWLLSGGRR